MTMQTVDLAIIQLAITNTEHAIVQAANVEEGPEAPLSGSQLRRLNRAVESLEAARMDLRAAIGLRPLHDMPMGESFTCVEAPASTGSRRSE